MIIKFINIVDAFDFISFGQLGEHQAYLNKESGKVYWVSVYGDNEEELPDDIDDKKYIIIPHKNELGLGKNLALDFTYTYLPNESEKIESMFRRKGAYSKFKEILESNGVIDHWYVYESDAREKELRAWCKMSEIEVHG